MTGCPNRAFYRRSTASVAERLVGMKLVRTIAGNGMNVRLSGIIVETEAYGGLDDPASHARMGPTPRNSVMFGEVGVAYVYFTYGNHFCVNVSARSQIEPAGAVLIRALEPLEGIEIMKLHRDEEESTSLTNGPGKLTQALNIDSALNGVDMTSVRSELHIEFGEKPREVVSATRIGISRATEKRWRFVDPFSRCLSRKIQIKV